MIPDAIKRFVAVFEKLPSIGPRQATRLAFRLIASGKATIDDVERAVQGLLLVKICSQCFFIHSQEGALCPICADTSRDACTFMVVEKETDLITIERTGKYKGRYIIIGELTKSGVLESVQKLRLGLLKKIIESRCPDKKAKEIILALNPTTYGDLNTMLIQKELKEHTQKISRLGRGIPTGGEIEFADEETLSHSLQRRE